jgi:hypothetical protein
MDAARADAPAGASPTPPHRSKRALRIEPRNCACRSSRALAAARLCPGGAAPPAEPWAEANDALRADNWRLIAQARQARGDADGESGPRGDRRPR